MLRRSAHRGSARRWPQAAERAEWRRDLAVRGGRVVGALSFGNPPAYVASDPGPERYIVLLVTDRDHNGEGIGARLLDHARAVAVDAGAELLRESQGFTATQRFTMAQPADPWPGQVLARRLR
ncbi:GNAT family N-acetyltransferase [Actinoplanes sp. NPDC024001]|uniref:GNAT family N-acetyltransferase n=1 Tax=Actinoplanes sp. NPDC024001 TaxID=3154598 RepID=UPI0033C8100B